jgi:hypothetical protein
VALRDHTMAHGERIAQNTPFRNENPTNGVTRLGVIS